MQGPGIRWCKAGGEALKPLPESHDLVIFLLPRRPLYRLGSGLSAGRSFHFLKKGAFAGYYEAVNKRVILQVLGNRRSGTLFFKKVK